MRLPQPSSGNLNRQHGSDSGLRPPSAMSSGIRPPIGSAVNGSSLMRPQFKVPQPPPSQQAPVNSIRGPAIAATNLARPTQLVRNGDGALLLYKQRILTFFPFLFWKFKMQPRSSATTQPPARSSLLPNAASKLKPLQLVAPRASAAAALPVKAAVIPAAKAAVDELNATVIMDKPSVVAAAPSAPTAPVLSGIPRPSMSRIPMPRTMK